MLGSVEIGRGVFVCFFFSGGVCEWLVLLVRGFSIPCVLRGSILPRPRIILTRRCYIRFQLLPQVRDELPSFFKDFEPLFYDLVLPLLFYVLQESALFKVFEEE